MGSNRRLILVIIASILAALLVAELVFIFLNKNPAFDLNQSDNSTSAPTSSPATESTTSLLNVPKTTYLLEQIENYSDLNISSANIVLSYEGKLVSIDDIERTQNGVTLRHRITYSLADGSLGYLAYTQKEVDNANITRQTPITNTPNRATISQLKRSDRILITETYDLLNQSPETSTLTIFAVAPATAPNPD